MGNASYDYNDDDGNGPMIVVFFGSVCDRRCIGVCIVCGLGLVKI